MKTFLKKANVEKYIINLKYSNDKDEFMEDMKINNVNFLISNRVIKKHLKLFEYNKEKTLEFIQSIGFEISSHNEFTVGDELYTTIVYLKHFDANVIIHNLSK